MIHNTTNRLQHERHMSNTVVSINSIVAVVIPLCLLCNHNSSNNTPHLYSRNRWRRNRFHELGASEYIYNELAQASQSIPRAGYLRAQMQRTVPDIRGCVINGETR